KRNLIQSMRSGFVLLPKRKQVFIQKISLEYNDNIMKLNNLEKRKLRNLWTDSQHSKTRHVNEVLVT
ncbi:MAG: hypothetical protein ACPGN7_06940, partial [Nitrosopumilus sp.]